MVTYADAIEDSPYSTLRDVQQDGIEATIKAVDDDGFLVLEGPCGTGKTLLSLLPLTSYVKSPSTKYNQVLVITSVKQQQEIFEEELRSINEVRRENDKEPVTAVTLVGKQDVCPYVKHDTIESRKIQGKCESLREGTRDQLRNADDEHIAAKRMKIQAQPEGRETVRRFDTDGTYEYPYDVDEYPEGSCPFYAGYMQSRYDNMDKNNDYHPSDVVPFDLSSIGVMDASDMVAKSGKAGMCPHSILGESIEYSDVVIGNYMHVFDERTRNFTEEIIREDTLVVVDEAHNLVPRVRDILSDEATLTQTFYRGLLELRELYALTTDSFGDDEYWYDYEELSLESSFLETKADVEKAVEMLEGLRHEKFGNITTADGQEKVSKAATGSSSSDLSEVLEAYEGFLTDLYEQLSDMAEEELESSTAPTEMALRDPEKLKPDKITQWLELKGDIKLLRNAEAFGKSMTALKSFLTTEIYEDPTVETKVQDLSEFLQKWADVDIDRYFQSMEIHDRSYQPNKKFVSRDWQADYKVSLKVSNALPRTEIKDTIDSFGGGVFMSATLEPLDMYVEETGLSLFDEDRPIVQRSYGLRYPKENRETIISPTTKFKYSKRGDTEDRNGEYNQSHPVRKEYKKIITSVVSSTPGNVMVVMPSYAEAWWAGEVVKDMGVVPRDSILVDEQSSLQETTDLKEDFFKGGRKVLVTGARGTLTEGVDYQGEKLEAVVVCGVPIANTNTLFNTAVETTYDKYFEDGFDFAFTLPAVRKTRQAIGRVIRGEKEVGVRVFADERYDENTSNWDSVHRYLPQSLKDEVKTLSPEETNKTLNEFWERHT